MRTVKARRVLPPLLAAITVLLAACGGGEGSRSANSEASGMDRAFVEAMIPHHESAVEMAEIAQQRSQHTEVKDLAEAIVETQNAEIGTMRTMSAEMEKAGVEKGELDMEMDHMGMDGNPASLENVKPFDREFIDMMIPHHQGAIRMARMQLDEGKDPEVRKLAQAIIDAQAKEIDEMNTWRVDWYGGLSPAGGVPAEAHEEAEHH